MTTAILECSFHSDKEISVLPIFQFLRITRGGERTRYAYERFTGKPSFEDALKDIRGRASDGEISRLYMSAHGSKERVGRVDEGRGLSVEDITRGIDALLPTVRGLYIGSCYFGTDKNLLNVLNALPNLQWVAGYDGCVDYSDGLSLDLVFFRSLFAQSGSDEASNARKSAEKTREYCGGLVKAYGFEVYWRDAKDVLCLTHV